MTSDRTAPSTGVSTRHLSQPRPSGRQAQCPGEVWALSVAERRGVSQPGSQCRGPLA